MEVGAVKHALNNEIIHVKKKLNQAKIQMINKLTRKAKTLKPKETASEQLNEKLRRKAESAVAEVLLLKKVQAKDLMRFAISHQGQLKDYLNKPKLDNDKVFAKILLHKALAEKYASLRETFANMPVDVLLVTRKERLKLKKERALALKNKNEQIKKSKDSTEDDTVLSTENIDELKEIEKSYKLSDDHADLDESEQESVENEESEGERSDNVENDTELNSVVVKPSAGIEILTRKIEITKFPSKEAFDNENESKESLDLPSNTDLVVSKQSTKTQKFIPKTKPKVKEQLKKVIKKPNTKSKSKKPIKKSQIDASQDEPEPPALVKVVDSFFITSSGENYMTLAEPRLPDEVKEIHQVGNRRNRRAQMLGNPKPSTRRKDTFHEKPGRFGNKERSEDSQYEKRAGATSQNKRQSESFETGKVNKKVDSAGKRKSEPAQEKLHPSWEAKKQKSGIVAFLGKKVVF